jgi:RNA-directed DNA polymerase
MLKEQVSAREWPARPDLTTPAAVGRATKLRRLQRQLWAAAKRAPGRRFHALYDLIHRSDVLWEAWKRVRRNRGAAGVDGQTLQGVVRGTVKYPEQRSYKEAA